MPSQRQGDVASDCEVLTKFHGWSASGNALRRIGTRMRIDDDKDLAEEVEGALRALGIAAAYPKKGDPQRIAHAVSDLRSGNGARRIEVTRRIWRQSRD